MQFADIPSSFSFSLLRLGTCEAARGQLLARAEKERVGKLSSKMHTALAEKAPWDLEWRLANYDLKA